jgi:hypothetical protein
MRSRIEPMKKIARTLRARRKLLLNSYPRILLTRQKEWTLVDCGMQNGDYIAGKRHRSLTVAGR